ncbi:MAG: universal stress protein [Planctomycetota bacterium]
MSVRRILVGLGLEACSETATRYALEIANLAGGSLTGVTLIDTPTLSHVGPAPIGAGALAHDLSVERTASVHRLTARLASHFRKACTAAGTPYVVRCEEGDPLNSLIAVARYHDIAIVGRDGLCEHGLMDEPSDGLVRLVGAGVRPMIVAPPDYRPIRRVMIAYSGSMESAKTMRRFIEMRLWPDAATHIVHFGSHREEGDQLLADAAEYCQAHGVQPVTELRDSSARKAVLGVADEIGADLIVMGNSARRLLVRRLFGETMLETVRHAELPLFLCQ